MYYAKQSYLLRFGFSLVDSQGRCCHSTDTQQDGFRESQMNWAMIQISSDFDRKFKGYRSQSMGTGSRVASSWQCRSHRDPRGKNLVLASASGSLADSNSRNSQDVIHDN